MSTVVCNRACVRNYLDYEFPSPRAISPEERYNERMHWFARMAITAAIRTLSSAAGASRSRATSPKVTNEKFYSNQVEWRQRINDSNELERIRRLKEQQIKDTVECRHRSVHNKNRMTAPKPPPKKCVSFHNDLVWDSINRANHILEHE